MPDWEALGIDIGGVIIDRVREDGGVPTSASYAGVVAVEGAFEAIADLVRRRFGERVWLVSRCDEPSEPVLLEWLEQRGFFGVTGVARERVRFCRQRHEKAAICRQLRITHFVDDRLEVLGHLVGLVPHLYLLESRAADADRFRDVLPRVGRMPTWRDVVEALLPAR